MTAELSSLLLPIVCGAIGYLIRHVNVFGQGTTLAPATAPANQGSHPVLDALAALINERISQRSAVASNVSTPTVPSAQS